MSKRKNKGPWKHEVMKNRRADAEKRQAVYDLLSPTEILAKLDKLGLVATKERAKLMKEISNG